MWQCKTCGRSFRSRDARRRNPAGLALPGRILSEYTGTPAAANSSWNALGSIIETTLASHPRPRNPAASSATCVSAPPRARFVESSTTFLFIA
jgi:hypothetical protein